MIFPERQLEGDSVSDKFKINAPLSNKDAFLCLDGYRTDLDGRHLMPESRWSLQSRNTGLTYSPTLLTDPIYLFREVTKASLLKGKLTLESRNIEKHFPGHNPLAKMTFIDKVVIQDTRGIEVGKLQDDYIHNRLIFEQARNTRSDFRALIKLYFYLFEVPRYSDLRFQIVGDDWEYFLSHKSHHPPNPFKLKTRVRVSWEEFCTMQKHRPPINIRIPNV